MYLTVILELDLSGAVYMSQASPANRADLFD